MRTVSPKRPPLAESVGLALVLRAFRVIEAFEQFQFKAKLPAFLTESLPVWTHALCSKPDSHAS